MRVLIIEDEAPIAAYIENQLREIVGGKLKSVRISYSVEEGLREIREKDYDLCLLDLNLRGKSGYEILKRTAARPFHTVIISAHSDKAIEAFEYGVIDFVPKPFTRERLAQAIERFYGTIKTPSAAKYLSYRIGTENRLIQVSDIMFIKACRYLAEVWLTDERRVLIEKSLNRLEQILPDDFIRIHRSYIVNLKYADSYQHQGSSRYTLRLKDGLELPVSRERLPVLKTLLGAN